MDKFSELVAKGVAAFNYTPIANAVPEQCPLCKVYNNFFGAATDTHMHTLEDGRKVITGHMIANKKMFDKFIWSTQFMGVDFGQCVGKPVSFANWMYNCHLKGHYDVLNHDKVYILEPIKDEDKGGPVGESSTYSEPIESQTVMSVTTENNDIPQSSRILSRHNDINDITECVCDTIEETVKAFNESKDVFGNNWIPVQLSDGIHIVGAANGKIYKF